MICDHAEKCEWGNCEEVLAHELNAYCEPDPNNEDSICPCHTDAKCIPYIDPVLKRVQERFNTEIEARVMEKRGQAIMLLDRIIKEESER